MAKKKKTNLQLGKIDQRSDLKKRREGAWMEWPFDPELAFKVRRSNEDDVQREVRKLRRAGELESAPKKEDQEGSDPVEIAERQYEAVLAQLAHPKVLARVLVTDWRGVYDDDGEAAEYDPEEAEEVFADLDYQHLCKWIAQMAVSDRNYQKDAEDEGNSSPPASNGSSGGGGKSKKTKGSKG